MSAAGSAGRLGMRQLGAAARTVLAPGRTKLAPRHTGPWLGSLCLLVPIAPFRVLVEVWE